MWKTPKTNWISTDIVYLEDWQRWVNNALYLYQLLGEPFEWQECSLNSIWDMPYVDVVNRLESNLWNLQLAIVRAGIAYTQELWYPVLHPNWQHRNPSYEDFNRWEQFELSAHQILTSIATLYSGTFTANQDGVRQSLGRGNI